MKNRNRLIEFRKGFVKTVFYLSAFGGGLTLLFAIVLFFFLLFNEEKQNFYYLVASSSAIGFGLMSLAFSLNAIMKKRNEEKTKRSEKAEEVLVKFNAASHNIEWVLLVCISEELKTKASIDYASSISKTKSEYALEVVEKVDRFLEGNSIDFVDLVQKIVDGPFKAFYKGKQSGTNHPLEVALKLNWALGEMEPICYAYSNDEFEGEIFKESIREEIIPIFTLYLVFKHYGYFERSTNYIEPAIFENLEK